MKTPAYLALAAFTTFAAFTAAKPAQDPRVPETPRANPPVIDGQEENRIQIALLLDTSNSMDGLIDQAVDVARKSMKGR